jgi:ABC-type multidrug transport system ATPase subunit
MEHNCTKGIHFDKVSFQYLDQSPLFSDLTLDLQSSSGHIAAMMGASGVGKSTLLNLIMGINKPVSGKINVSPANAVISYIPQEPVLFEHLTPLMNATYFFRTSAYKRLFDQEFFTRMSAALGMDKILHESKSVEELSGGQRQRLMLLRALSIKPHILILDEPTTGLDADAKLKFMNILREIVVKQNLLAIYCTHHMNESLLIADEICYVNEHQKIFRQSLASFVVQPVVMEALQALRYPRPNLLCVTLNKESRLQPATIKDDNHFYICLDEDQLRFDKKDGLPFSMSVKNPLFSQINVGGQFITLTSKILSDDQSLLLLINGALLCYDQHQVASGTITIKNGYAI